jgi:hypothetical protein
MMMRKSLIIGIVLLMILLVVAGAVWFTMFRDANGGVGPGGEIGVVEPTAVPTPEVVLVEPTLTPTLEPTSTPTFTPTPDPTVTPTSEPTLTPTSEPTLAPTPTQTTEPKERVRKFRPLKEYGRVVASEVVEIELPSGMLMESDFTQQVKSTGEFTLFFALYNESGDLVWEVLVRDYIEGEDLKNAQIYQYFQDNTQRMIVMDRQRQTMEVSYTYILDPYPQNIFSVDARRELSKEDIVLSSTREGSSVELSFDLTGTSDDDRITFTQGAPGTGKSSEVETAFAEVEGIIRQIEQRRSISR